MPALKAAIVRFVDESQPGWVECRFKDIAGVEHALVEKVPVVTREPVTPDGRFPVPISIECVVRCTPSETSIVTVDLELPWGLQSKSGLTQFAVGADQIVPCVFVSCADIDASEPQALLAALRDAGCVVDHSPRQPSVGDDSRWSTWYERGLQQAVTWADGIVIVIDDAWDSSSWMAEEARQALEVYGVPNAFFWNPRDLQLLAMHPYLRTHLPQDPEAAARIVRSTSPRAV